MALLASLMIGLFIRETLPAERRQPFHLRTTLGNFATLVPPQAGTELYAGERL